MTHFNLIQLRHDVIDHADLPASIWCESSSYVISWIDFIIEALIGSDHYDLMIQHPNALIVFKEINDNVKDGQYLCMYHGLTN